MKYNIIVYNYFIIYICISSN